LYFGLFDVLKKIIIINLIKIQPHKKSDFRSFTCFQGGRNCKKNPRLKTGPKIDDFSNVNKKMIYME